MGNIKKSNFKINVKQGVFNGCNRVIKWLILKIVI